jgi:hypothetical protein
MMKARDIIYVASVIVAVLSISNGCVPHLHSSHGKLSVTQVQSIPNVSITKEEVWGFCGYSTIVHDYELMTIKGDKVVIDYSTELMWHQSGSDEHMSWSSERFFGLEYSPMWNKAKRWVRKLNKRGYAGYHDWRLPTLEEAVSLLESGKKNGDLYIDPLFSDKQRWIWTGDKYSTGEVWAVTFDYGGVNSYGVYSRGNYVRPVRSGN